LEGWLISEEDLPARERRRHAVSNAFIPRYFAPGEAYQIDFSHKHVEIDGVECVVKLAQEHLRPTE
jgi:hypothetical protein